MRAARAIPAALAAASILSAAPAWAHGSAGLGEFYAGLAHPLMHFETLLPILALGLWAAQRDDDDLWRVPLVFVAAAAAGAGAALFGLALPASDILLPASMLVLGAAVAAALAVPLAVSAPLAIAVGVAVGGATAAEARAEVQRPWLYLSGLTAGLLMGQLYIVGHLPSLAARFPWLRVAARVLGSWIAATGLLVLVLALVGPRPAPP